MALSDVALCTRALIRIGAAPISSFEDNTAEAEVAGALYEPTRDGLLSAYPWSFATTQRTLTPLVDAPTADYDYAYQLPSDFLRSISVGQSGRGRGLEFRIHGRELHANVDSIVLSYIYLPSEGTMPPFFEQCLIAYLSAEFCLPLTESSTRAELLFKQAEDLFRRSKYIDAQQDTPNRLESYSLIDARGQGD